jgi:hypothetical protein
MSFGWHSNAFQLPNKSFRRIFRCDIMFFSTRHVVCHRRCGDFSSIGLSFLFLFFLTKKLSPYFFISKFFYPFT